MENVGSGSDWGRRSLPRSFFDAGFATVMPAASPRVGVTVALAGRSPGVLF